MAIVIIIVGVIALIVIFQLVLIILHKVRTVKEENDRANLELKRYEIIQKRIDWRNPPSQEELDEIEKVTGDWIKELEAEQEELKARIELEKRIESERTKNE